MELVTEYSENTNNLNEAEMNASIVEEISSTNPLNAFTYIVVALEVHTGLAIEKDKPRSLYYQYAHQVITTMKSKNISLAHFITALIMDTFADEEPKQEYERSKYIMEQIDRINIKDTLTYILTALEIQTALY